MSRIDIRIRSLVVHGTRPFADDAFSAALRDQIEQRIRAAGRAGDLAGRFRTDAAPGEAPQRDTRFESITAARVAGRLLPWAAR
jgi:hypothetical protein